MPTLLWFQKFCRLYVLIIHTARTLMGTRGINNQPTLLIFTFEALAT